MRISDLGKVLYKNSRQGQLLSPALRRLYGIKPDFHCVRPKLLLLRSCNEWEEEKINHGMWEGNWSLQR